jgi:malonyl-CoA O-methyltransferase
MSDVIPSDERPPQGGGDLDRQPLACADPVAARRVLRRLGASADRPWLHEEVSRRMVERLQWLKAPPATALLWWPAWAAQPHALKSVLPGLECSLVEAFAPVQSGHKPEPRGFLKRWGWTPFASLSPTPSPPAHRQSEVDPWLVDDPGVSPAEAAGAGGAKPKSSVQGVQPVEPPGVDLFWAPWVLHMHPAPCDLLRHAWARLKPGGVLMFSSLGPGSLQTLRALYQQMGWPAPASDYVDMHDWGDQLLSSGFADPVLDQEVLTLHWQEPESLLRDLRAWGGNTSRARFQGLRTAAWRQRLLQALRAGVADSGRLELQLELIYGQAFKPEAALPMKAETRVGLSEMRQMLRGGRKPV